MSKKPSRTSSQVQRRPTLNFFSILFFPNLGFYNPLPGQLKRRVSPLQCMASVYHTIVIRTCCSLARHLWHQLVCRFCLLLRKFVCFINPSGFTLINAIVKLVVQWLALSFRSNKTAASIPALQPICVECACSPHARLGSLLVLQLPRTIPNHAR